MPDEKSFLWNGNAYAKNSSSQFKRALIALEKLHLTPKTSVLDIGCGNGSITALIAQHVYPAMVKGLDKDPSMIKKAQELTQKNLTFVKGDAEFFELSQRFHVITSFFCLQWLNEKSLAKAMKNIFKHLTEQGEVCFLIASYDFPHEIIKGVAFSPKWRSYFTSYHEPQTFLTIDQYNTIMQQTGFIHQKVIEVTSEHFLTNQGFIDFTYQWCECYRYIKDEETRKKFIQDIKYQLSKEKHDSEGKFCMIQKSIYITAQRSALTLTTDRYAKTSTQPTPSVTVTPTGPPLSKL